MNRILLFLCAAMLSTGAFAQTDPDVTVSLQGKNGKMSNGLLTIQFNETGRVSIMKVTGNNLNLLSSNGVYFDYTAESNSGLSPNTAEIISKDPDYGEVVYRRTTGDLLLTQGYILRKGDRGFYTYVIMEGTENPVSVREARVCVRTAAAMLTGYVDERMQGSIPTTGEMLAVESSSDRTIQDATYRLDDGTIYTKYNWAQYIVKDSVHGLMNKSYGVWNIPCSYEWLNGGPMRQELTVHATGKSPITIQMLQGEHFGAAPMTLAPGQKKLYGPIYVYVNNGTHEEMIADAKAEASRQMAAWPFAWFHNDLYPLDRATVSGQINLTDGQSPEGLQVVLGGPEDEIYRQTGGYMFWAKTDKNGYFTIPNVRKGDYTLYAYATTGTITDQMRVDDISVTDSDTQLGLLYWHPSTLENQLWSIGVNDRLSDGYKMSDDLRAYGLFSQPEANINFTIGESDPLTDLYYAQTKNGTWTFSFNLDREYEGDAILTASVAGATNSPKVAVGVNGETVDNWSFYNDAAIYRSALLGGRHSVYSVKFPAAKLKPGLNTVTLKMSGISRNGGVMWDCIKLEAGKPVEAGLETIMADSDSELPVEIYTITGVKVAECESLGALPALTGGIYIYRQGTRTGKFAL